MWKCGRLRISSDGGRTENVKFSQSSSGGKWGTSIVNYGH